jgi:hypothetical protein
MRLMNGLPKPQGVWRWEKRFFHAAQRRNSYFRPCFCHILVTSAKSLYLKGVNIGYLACPVFSVVQTEKNHCRNRFFRLVGHRQLPLPYLG